MDVDKSDRPDGARLTKLKAAAIDLSTLKKLIGNSKPQMTMHYYADPNLDLLSLPEVKEDERS